MPKALPFCALIYGLAVLLGNGLTVRPDIAALCLLASLTGLVLAWWHKRLLGVALLGLMAATGLRAQAQRPQPPQRGEIHDLLGNDGRADPVTVSAMLRDSIRPTANAHLLPLTILSLHRSDGSGGCLDEPLRFTLLVSGSPSESLLPGDLLRVRTVLRAASLDEDSPSDRQRTVHSDTAVIGTAHFHDLAVYEAFAKPDCRPPLSDRVTRWWRRPMERLRLHFRHQITQLPGAAETKAVLIALCLGWRGDLAAENRLRREAHKPSISEGFTDAGIAHILSVSGLHLALVGWLLYRGLASLLSCWPWLGQRWATQRIAAATAAPFVLGYTLLTGAEPPTVRAACVLILWLGAVATGRRADLAHGLALAVFCTGLPIPPGGALQLTEASWQLSMAATLGLTYLRPIDGWWVQTRSPAPGILFKLSLGLRRALSATLGATLATAPLGALFFGRFVATGLVANLAVVPLGELVVLPLGLFGLVLQLAFPTVGGLVLQLAMHATALLLWLTNHFAALGLAWTVPAPPLAWLLLFTVGLLVAALRRPWGYLICLLAIGFYLLDWQRPKTELRLTALSVGQGDSLAVELPSRQVLVVDAGPRSEDGHDAARSVIAPYLHQRGIHRIDWLVVTHAHPDHTGGMLTLLHEFDVTELWLEPLPGPSSGAATTQQRRELSAAESTFAQLRQAAAARHTRVVPPHSLLNGDVSVEALTAPPDPSLSLNDASVMLRLRYGGRTLLLTGDIEQAREDLLRASGVELQADVLKAPHHCSRTSSTEPFVHAVSPSLVLCSVGRHNRFGFPHPSVVERYQRAHSQILRTDQLGSISVSVSRTGRLAITATTTARFFF